MIKQRHPTHSAKRRREFRRPYHTPSPSEVATAREHQWAETQRWRRGTRWRALRATAARAASLRWSRPLLALILDELGTHEEVEALVGRLDTLPTYRYPQAVAVAIVLRHSWRHDDLARVARRLRAAARPGNRGD